ncbi:MAG: hypothetical protein IJ035_07625 [Oscillospiraceae bacterium]|nr:hypothetical protein [Oscillospiraceae bacterium]
MKKLVTIILALAMSLTCFTACGKGDEENAASENAYAGILTKVKLGMPLTKVVSLQPDGVELYYEDDVTIWSVNTDTELNELRNVIAPDHTYYYVDDSIITYNFRTVKGDDEIYLDGYMSEVTCLLDRDTATKYFEDKTAELSKKHGAEPVGAMTGTEGMDMNLTYTQKYDCPSYNIVFTMVETYDTVNGVDGYYGTYFALEIIEKEVKSETAIGGETEAAEE